jgi:hypothetical protein
MSQRPTCCLALRELLAVVLRKVGLLLVLELVQLLAGGVVVVAHGCRAAALCGGCGRVCDGIAIV